MPDTDKLAAALDAIRDRERAVQVAYCNGVGGNEAARESADDVRRLRAAVEAALSNHEPLSSGGPHGGAWCPTCYRIAPCETRKAITRELLGEEVR